MSKVILEPSGWAPPRGYANGVCVEVGGARHIFVAGQIGWSERAVFESDDLVDQVRQALLNVRAVLAVAGAGPEHICRMTWYVVSRAEYLARGREIGAVYREVLGREYGVAMSAVEVSALMEARALVEVEVTAVVG